MSPPPDASAPSAASSSEGSNGDEGPDGFESYEGARPRPAARPWLLANMVAGLDGSLAWNGRVGALSSAADRELFVRLRALADGVLVGAGTVRAEGYGPVQLPEPLRRRREESGRSPVPPLVVVTRSLALDWAAPLWADHTEQSGTVPVVVTVSAAPPDALEQARRHADVVVAGERSVDVRVAMGALAERGMDVVLTEGGPTLLDELVEADVLDELCLTVAPFFGGDPLTMAHREQAAAELRAFALAGCIQRDDEVFLRYLRPSAAASPPPPPASAGEAAPAV